MTHRHACCFLSALFAVAMPAAMSRASQVFDASADFDPMNNPSAINGGAYSYGYTETPGGAFSLLPGTFTNGPVEGYYHTDLPDGAPSISKNTAATEHVLAGGSSLITYEPQQLVLHPGRLGEYAVLRFTAPATGGYSFEATFNSADSATASTDVHALINGIAVDDADIDAGMETATLSSPSVLLAAGDTLDFAVGKGSNAFFFDSTGLFATVALVPEPSTLLLLAAGGVIVAALRPRRFTSRARTGRQ